MATTTIVTVGGTANLPTTNELLIDMMPKRMTSYASVTTLTTILSRLSANPAHNYTIEAIEENEIPTQVEIATTEASAGTTIYLKAYGTSLVAGQCLYHPGLNDQRLISATPTTNTVSVTLSQGGTTSAAWTASDIVEVLPTALPENSEVLDPVSAVDSRQYNYQQLIKLYLAITRMENDMSTQFGGPGEKRKRLQAMKYRQFRVLKEKLAWFGGRQTGGTAPATRRMAAGIQAFTRSGTLFKDFGGVGTESAFDGWLGNYIDQNPDANNIACFAAPNVIRHINYFAKDKIRISPNSKEYGLSLNRYIGGPLAVDLIPTPIFNGPDTKGWLFLLDLSRMKYTNLQNSGDTLYLDAKGVGQSEIIYDCYRGVSSLLVCNESRHAMGIGWLM